MYCGLPLFILSSPTASVYLIVLHDGKHFTPFTHNEQVRMIVSTGKRLETAITKMG